ncbi:MAG: Nramp family divalent metal transporter [Thermoanaerobaculia bacterium]
MRRLTAILLWSVIAAAFIGPGTVTTAAAAGAGFGLALLWTLVFSTVACLVLQEASARLTLVSGRNLGQALRHRYPAGFTGTAVLLLVLGAIVLGCAAYEAGNILGGVAGAVLATGRSPKLLALASGVIAGLLLWFNKPRRVAHLLSIVVAVMGVAFLFTAWQLRPELGEILRGALMPSLPTGSALLAIGLVGTTVVPYNIFLGSGIAGGQSLGELRLGLAVAVGLGGLISMGVLVAGTAVDGAFSFQALSLVLAERLGPWAASLFAIGLFGAGISSAITAPLAAAVTARSLFQTADNEERWSERSWRYRSVWLAVLLTGLGFGLSDVAPIPAIVLAQALNGVLLPIVAIFLLLEVNDRRSMGEREVNGLFSNGVMTLVVAVTVLLGTANLARAVARTLGWSAPTHGTLLVISAVVVILVSVPVYRAWERRRRP